MTRCKGYGHRYEGRFSCGCHEIRGYRHLGAEKLVERLKAEKEELESELGRVSELLEKLDRG